MISLSTISSAAGAADYYARDNYYTVDQAEVTSAWAGKGAESLGLDGPVEEHAFEAVLAGKLPDGSVIDAKRGERRPGHDLTFSVSKSVSLIALLGGDERIAKALQQSVKATLGWVEKNLIETRVWDGEKQRPARTGNMLAATFLHDVNRNGEPQLHVHAVVVNATRDAQGKWRALRNDQLYDRQHAIGAVFNAELRQRIEALGYTTVPARNAIDGSFEIEGVSREVIDAFSTRSAEIRAALAPGGRGSARERELAALATRGDKRADLDRAGQLAAWSELARANGFAPERLIEQARARSDRGATMWTSVVEGVRGAAAKGMAVAAAMRLTPTDGDPLVPERRGRLDPVAWATAQAVASAVRDLGEREAAFDRIDLVRTSLEKGGPVTVGNVEARIALLEARGLLIGDGEHLVTTQGAVKQEQRLLDLSREGIGKGTVILAGPAAALAAQTAARDLGLRRLTPRQEAAAVLLLYSPDRLVNVQGVAGAGKSAVLAPVARIAREHGVPVLGLAIAGTVARDLAVGTGAPTSTVARFLARHARILAGTASAKQLDGARGELKGAIIIVDETSMVGTTQMTQLIALSQMLEVGRLALVGDTRQLGAVDAGKPFAQLQADGHATAHLPDNLRARSQFMKDTAAALNAGDVARAFALLAPHTREVARGAAPGVAARQWASLSPAERDKTLLLASGRAMRSAANLAAQTELKGRGELGEMKVTLPVLDRMTITREGAREMRAYSQGRVVEWRTDLPSQGLARGERGTVIDSKQGKVTLRMTDGRVRVFEPDKLPRNLKADAVSVYVTKQIDLHQGDRIRWTDNDHPRGMLNADLARVETIDAKGITVASLADGTVHRLAQGDRMLERLDLAYALNVHIAQGVTSEHGIVMMSAAERGLASEKAFLVALTRIADSVTLVLDSGRQLERAVMSNPGDKTSALDVAQKKSEKESVPHEHMNDEARRSYLDQLPVPKLEKSLGLEL